MKKYTFYADEASIFYMILAVYYWAINNRKEGIVLNQIRL